MKMHHSANARTFTNTILILEREINISIVFFDYLFPNTGGSGEQKDLPNHLVAIS